MIGHEITLLNRIEMDKNIIVKYFDMPLDNRHNYFYKIEYEKDKIWFSRKYYRNIYDMYLASKLKIKEFQNLLKNLIEK